MSRIAGELHVTVGTLTTNMNSLERKGYLTRNRKMCIRDSTVGLRETEEELDLNYCRDSYKEEVPYALTNSLGFGGHNASLLLKK